LRAAVFSVDTSPVDSKTTKRPLALIPPVLDLKPPGEDVNWILNGSGVALGVCARTELLAPKTSVNTTKAQRDRASLTESSGIKTQIRAD
jgi:hypothetical protein